MNKIEIHPLSATIGAALAFLLLFACSSSSGTSVIAPAPIVTTPVTFYADTPGEGAGGAWNGFGSVATFSIGTTAAPTVITDVSWTNRFGSPSRLLVNGAPVYAWGWDSINNNSGTVASRFSLTHGILVPAGAVLTVEAHQFATAYSLAGYTL